MCQVHCNYAISPYLLRNFNAKNPRDLNLAYRKVLYYVCSWQYMREHHKFQCPVLQFANLPINTITSKALNVSWMQFTALAYK